jgi:hypothetical protein
MVVIMVLFLSARSEKNDLVGFGLEIQDIWKEIGQKKA